MCLVLIQKVRVFLGVDSRQLIRLCCYLSVVFIFEENWHGVDCVTLPIRSQAICQQPTDLFPLPFSVTVWRFSKFKRTLELELRCWWKCLCIRPCVKHDSGVTDRCVRRQSWWAGWPGRAPLQDLASWPSPLRCKRERSKGFSELHHWTPACPGGWLVSYLPAELESRCLSYIIYILQVRE